MQNMNLSKGEVAEEVLRDYFLEQDYFVVRGIPFKYKSFDVTDVDLWLYIKTSSLTRERINVDIKRKKTPQALERIFWAKGLQTVLGLDKCVVCTTDKRQLVREFGTEHDVHVLDGDFYSRLTSRGLFNSDRISEEDLLLHLSSQDNYSSEQSQKYKISKTYLLTKLDFDGVNSLLKDIKYWMEKAIISKDVSNIISLRMLYITISFFLINLDYISKNIIHLNQDSRFSYLRDGFRYGQMGEGKSQDIIEIAIKLSSSMNSSSQEDVLRNVFFDQYKILDTEILAEFFSKVSNLKILFDNALTFEEYGYANNIKTPSQLGVEMKSLIGLLSDFLGIDRKNILDI